MYQVQKIIIIICIGIFLFSLSFSTARAEDCTLFIDAYTNKLLPAKQAIEDKLKDLTTKPDTSTPYLTEQGVKDIREYHAEISNICTTEILQKVDQCDTISQEQFKQQEYDPCMHWVWDDTMTQENNFEKFMIFDAGMKKYQFIVNKYQDLNKKFRDLITLIGFIKGGLDHLLKNVGEYLTKQQAQGS